MVTYLVAGARPIIWTNASENRDPPLLGGLIHHCPPASYFLLHLLLSPSPPLQLQVLHQSRRAPQMICLKTNIMRGGRPAILPTSEGHGGACISSSFVEAELSSFPD